jgi:hypothetical protein
MDTVDRSPSISAVALLVALVAAPTMGADAAAPLVFHSPRLAEPAIRVVLAAAPARVRRKSISALQRIVYNDAGSSLMQTSSSALTHEELKR